MKHDGAVLTGCRGFLVAEGVVVRVSTDTTIGIISMGSTNGS